MNRDRFRAVGGGAPLFPLAVLFGLVLLDQATQSAFNVLIPNVRDAFHLSDAEILSIVALGGAAALLGTVPVAWLADRTVRVRIALIGAPNAGKSSLLNRLAGREAAIVTATPGTTRDVIEVPAVLDGFKVLFADMAGLRSSDDPIEAEGVTAMRPVTVTHQDTETAVVEKGVSAGDRVVTVGQYILQPGTLVAIDTAANTGS